MYTADFIVLQRQNDSFIQESKLLILGSVLVIKVCAKWYPYSQCATYMANSFSLVVKEKKEVANLKKYG